MATPIPFNKRGTYGLESIDAVVSNNTLTYMFEAHPFVNTPFNGLLLIHLVSPAPATTTGEMPIYFETRGMSGTRRPVTKAGGVPLTAADIKVPCYLLFFYDYSKGVVEAVSAVPGTDPA